MLVDVLYAVHSGRLATIIVKQGQRQFLYNVEWIISCKPVYAGYVQCKIVGVKFHFRAFFAVFRQHLQGIERHLEFGIYYFKRRLKGNAVQRTEVNGIFGRLFKVAVELFRKKENKQIDIGGGKRRIGYGRRLDDVQKRIYVRRHEPELEAVQAETVAVEAFEDHEIDSFVMILFLEFVKDAVVSEALLEFRIVRQTFYRLDYLVVRYAAEIHKKYLL